MVYQLTYPLPSAHRLTQPIRDIVLAIAFMARLHVRFNEHQNCPGTSSIWMQGIASMETVSDYQYLPTFLELPT